MGFDAVKLLGLWVFFENCTFKIGQLLSSFKFRFVSTFKERSSKGDLVLRRAGTNGDLVLRRTGLITI